MKNKDPQEMLDQAKKLLGERIKAKRKKKRLSQKKLSALSGVTRSTLIRIEKGQGVHFDYYLILAAALNTQIATLLKGV